MTQQEISDDGKPKIHKDDWDTWVELTEALKVGKRPNLNSTKRKRAVLAIAEIVDGLVKSKEIKTTE
jgi:hypothetical protein